MQAIRKIQFIFKGYRNFTKREKPQPTLEGSLEGVNYVITGANSGIGFEAAKFAAEKGAKVYLICRNPQRGQEAVNKIKQMTKNTQVFLILGEMGQKKQLDRIAEDIKTQVGRVDILVHNAGCMIHKLEYTSEKIQKNFATNTLSVYYLTKKLLPILHKDSRVIVVSSGGMYTEKLCIDDLYMEKDFDGTTQYARNKRQQICIIQQFAKLYPDKGLFLSMHPGWVDTEAVRVAMPDFYKKMKDDLKMADEGADTINYLSISPSKNIKNGAFYYDRQQVDKHLTIACTSYSQAQADRFMKKLEQLSAF